MSDNTQFVLPPAKVNDVIEQSKGDISKLEEIIGIPSGSWQVRVLSIIDIQRPSSLELRIPSGNVFGANSQWLPGDRLPTGMPEGVVDSIPKGSYTERKY